MFLLQRRLTKLDCLFLIFLISLDLSVVQLHGFPQFGSREELDGPGIAFHAPSSSFKDSFKELLGVETTDVISTIIPAPTTLSSDSSDDDDYAQAITFELENPIKVTKEAEHHDDDDDNDETTPIVLEDETSEPTQPAPEETQSSENHHHPQEENQESEKKEQENEAAVTNTKETPTVQEESKLEMDLQNNNNTNNNNNQEVKKEREREEELYTNHNLHASVEVEHKDKSESEKTEETKISETQLSPVDSDDDNKNDGHKNDENNKNNQTAVQSEETDQLQEPESSFAPQLISDSGERPTVGTINIREININNNSKEVQSQEINYNRTDVQSQEINNQSKELPSQESNNNDNGSSDDDDSTPQLGDTLINENNNTSTSNSDAELVTLDKFIRHGATYSLQNDDACLTAHKHKFLGKGLVLGRITSEECEREDQQTFDAIVMREDDETQTPNSEEYWLSSIKHSINEVSMVMTSNESAFFSNPLKNSIQIIPIDSDSSTFLIKSTVLGKCIENQGKHKEILYTACDSSSLSQQWKANFLYEDTKAKL